MGFVDHLADRWRTLVELAGEHAALVAIAVALATVVALALAIPLRRRPWAAGVLVGAGGALLAVPSLATLGLLTMVIDRGDLAALIALAICAVGPVLRGAVTGLRGVDPATLEAASGAGMGPGARLMRIELPLAWPAILAGMRVATAITLGIGAIAAVIDGPGLGEEILLGLSRDGASDALDIALGGVLGVLVLGILFEAAYALARRLTVPRGIR
ncbi:MAG: osmoprotectant transport system permease protein [Miltoncostaeaceae bacterium]|nr:osmoprotectant transport system permease protein [Miltoncostaeaceae bacterium]